jgi:putative aminopeptidase FrvX
LIKLNNLDLLKRLCEVHATAGNEVAMKNFLMKFIKETQGSWKQMPVIHQGPELQDNIILEFGSPRTAVFAHMDTVGFTVGYGNQLIPIGSPSVSEKAILVGKDHLGPIVCQAVTADGGEINYDFGRAIVRGTDLVFECNFREDPDFVQSCYLDNRLGIYTALELAASLENGLLVFSCREEHGGGAVPVLVRYIWETFRLQQYLIADITWVTSGITHGKGVAISLRDAGIPGKEYVTKILNLATKSGVDFQLEVEASGSSDARELQASPYPVEWCFIGAPESGVHSPMEKVHKYDIKCMLALYEHLMRNL